MEQVRAVNLRNCDIKYSNSKEIAAYVAKTTSLHSLCLRDNDIDAQVPRCCADNSDGRHAHRC